MFVSKSHGFEIASGETVRWLARKKPKSSDKRCARSLASGWRHFVQFVPIRLAQAGAACARDGVFKVEFETLQKSQAKSWGFSL